MTDPTGFMTTKIASMIGGLFGGAAILTFIRPKTIGEAFMRGGVSVGSSVIFSTPFLKFLEIKDDWEAQLMAGFCIGFLSYSILGMIANLLIKHQHKDIITAVKEIKDDVK